MENIYKIKREICDKVWELNPEKLYNLTLVMQDIIDINNTLSCEQCLQLYGDCIEVTPENKLCVKRFEDYCKN